MERKVLCISSYREDITTELSDMIRDMGRRFQRPLWGKRFENAEAGTSLLYLDSGGRGNLSMMAKGMDANAVEFIFADKETGLFHVLISEKLGAEYKEGELLYKRSKTSKTTIAKRVRDLDSFLGSGEFFSVSEPILERSPVYSAIEGEARINVINGNFVRGSISELIGREELPSVIICDVFSQNGVFAVLQHILGKPVVVHIMNRESHIYAPFLSLEKEIFIETEEFLKQALLAVCLWLFDSAEFKCEEKLYESFIKLPGGEELIKRARNNLMKINHRKRK